MSDSPESPGARQPQVADGTAQQRDDRTEPPSGGSSYSAVDIALAVLTLPLLLALLMFATTGMMEMLENPKKRRMLGVGLLVLEVAIVAGIVLLIQR